MNNNTYKEIENNESNVCAVCNGKCCRHMPCSLHPHDIFGDAEPTYEKFKEFLLSGNYQIDYWEGDVREHFDIPIEDEGHCATYYVRPQTKGNTNLVNPTYGGECVFFTDKEGCSLTFENRPYEGRALVPAASYSYDEKKVEKEVQRAMLFLTARQSKMVYEIVEKTSRPIFEVLLGMNLIDESKVIKTSGCHTEYDKANAALDWLPYHEWFERIIHEVG